MICCLFSQSLPSWERGLKLITGKYQFEIIGVAPLVGARIEIVKDVTQYTVYDGRSPRGSAD